MTSHEELPHHHHHHTISPQYHHDTSLSPHHHHKHQFHHSPFPFSKPDTNTHTKKGGGNWLMMENSPFLSSELMKIQELSTHCRWGHTPTTATSTASTTSAFTTESPSWAISRVCGVSAIPTTGCAPQAKTNEIINYRNEKHSMPFVTPLHPSLMVMKLRHVTNMTSLTSR